jgi:hypothetical protein
MSLPEEIITLDTIVTQSDDVISDQVGDEVVMLRLKSNAYYNTDDIGAVIWKQIATPQSVDDLCETLMELYDVPPDQCRTDVLSFLNQAYQEGTIRIV